MSLEIERKFLVEGDYKQYATGSFRISQGYICSVPGRTVRVRIMDEKGYITIKGAAREGGFSRFEWEMEIPLKDARDLMDLCDRGVIDKTRYHVPAGAHVFEVDEFHGDNAGLVVAEVELASEDEAFERPSWLGREVTGDRRYYNSCLLASPFCTWEKND